MSIAGMVLLRCLPLTHRLRLRRDFAASLALAFILVRGAVKIPPCVPAGC